MVVLSKPLGQSQGTKHIKSKEHKLKTNLKHNSTFPECARSPQRISSSLVSGDRTIDYWTSQRISCLGFLSALADAFSLQTRTCLPHVNKLCHAMTYKQHKTKTAWSWYDKCCLPWHLSPQLLTKASGHQGSLMGILVRLCSFQRICSILTYLFHSLS